MLLDLESLVRHDESHIIRMMVLCESTAHHRVAPADAVGKEICSNDENVHALS